MSVIQKNQIKDIEEFAKLFKLNIPIKEEFDYYFNTLKSSGEYSTLDLNNIVNLFCELEDFAQAKGFSNVYKFKMSELDRLKDSILQTKAYEKLIGAELSKIKHHSKDALNQVDEGEYLLSLDFVSANYNVLKTFDSDNELSETWKDFCVQVGLHKSLAASKSFRQVVFGNTNPKRLQTFQQDRMLKVYDYLLLNGYSEDKVVFLSHDEIILKILNSDEVIKINNSLEQLSVIASGMPIKATPFSIKKIKKNIFIKTVYNIVLSGTQSFFIDKYKTLQGVPGNKFYMYFKKYILEQPLDERDLMFVTDNELAKWVI